MAVLVVFFVAFFAKIAVTVAIPAMLVFDSAAPTFPVSVEKPLSVVVRSYPTRSRIRGASPVSFMPSIVALDWIPIAIHPDIIRPWRHWSNPNDVRRRWRADPDSERYLS